MSTIEQLNSELLSAGQIEKNFLSSGEEVDILKRGELNANEDEVITLKCGDNVITMIARGRKAMGDTNVVFLKDGDREVPLSTDSELLKSVKIIYMQEAEGADTAILSLLRNTLYIENRKTAVEDVLKAS